MTIPINNRLAELTGILAALRELDNGETMTQAATNLGVSQPALSRAISRCEADLAVKLIERAGRGISLTENGRTLARAAAEALAIFQPALEEVIDDRNARPVRLGTLRSVAGELAPLLAGEDLGQGINISEGSSQELLVNLKKGLIDAAVLGPRPEDQLFQWTFLRHQELVLVVPHYHWSSNRKSITLDEVETEKFVAMDPRYTTRDHADELCAEAGISPVITVESDSSHTLRTYVAAGVGLCILPEIMANTDPRITTVPIRRPNGDPATREIGLVKMNARPLPRKVRFALRTLTTRAPGQSPRVAV